MENNQITASQPISSTAPPIIQATNLPAQQPSSRLPIILLILLMLLSLSGLMYFYFQTQSLKQQLIALPSPKPSTTQSSSPNPTANWQTYTSPHNTTIQYPSDWKLDTNYITHPDSGQEALFSFSLSKTGHSLTISFPSGFGPGICIFKDQPKFNQELEPGPGSAKCPGEFVEIKTKTSILRRLTAPPQALEDGATPPWEIFTKDDYGNFITVPPITYKVPKNVNIQTVLIMDQILATFESTK